MRPTPSTLAQSKERKGSNFAIWQPWCSCRQTPRGIAPGAHLGDGNADLIMVRGTSRFNYLRYLVRVAFQRDSPFELPFVEVKRVREFRYSLYRIL